MLLLLFAGAGVSAPVVAPTPIPARTRIVPGMRVRTVTEGFMPISHDPKDPEDQAWFFWDWRRHLAAAETILTFTATPDATTTTATVSQPTAIGGVITAARVDDGAAGEIAEVQGQITTSAGQRLTCTAVIPIKAL